jgi:hypothetical protein
MGFNERYELAGPGGDAKRVSLKSVALRFMTKGGHVQTQGSWMPLLAAGSNGCVPLGCCLIPIVR